MAIVKEPTALEAGAALIVAARGEPLVRELWVSDESDGIHLWLIITPTENIDAQRTLYDLLYVLDARYPDTDFQLHVLNPLEYLADPRESLPQGAKQILLHAA